MVPGRQDVGGKEYLIGEDKIVNLPNAPFALKDARRQALAGSAGHARPGAQFLSQPDADQRRQERRLRRLGRFRRAGDGPLRRDRQEPRPVADRARVHAVRQLLHGRLRRLLPEPPVPDQRPHARILQCRRDPGKEEDRRAGGRPAGPPPGRDAGFAEVGARRQAEIRQQRRHHARRLCRQHDGAAVPAELGAPGAGRRSASGRPAWTHRCCRRKATTRSATCCRARA